MIPGQFDYVASRRPRPGAARSCGIGKGRRSCCQVATALSRSSSSGSPSRRLLVDMRDLSGLDGIVETDDELRIGARATHRQIHDDTIVRTLPGAPST